MGGVIHIGNDINREIKKKMKGKEWIKHLGDLERKLFEINLKNGHEADWYMGRDYDSFFGFISGAFSWLNTPEGDLYWRDIAYREIKYSIKYHIKKFKFV